MNRVLIAVLLLGLTAGFTTRGQEVAKVAQRVEVRVSFVHFPIKVIAREKAMRKTGTLPHADVMTLWAAGKGELQYTLSLVTLSGVAAEVQAVKEFIYPTEYEVQAAADPKDKTGTKVMPLLRPSAFETREAGFILNVTPTVLEDGQYISLTLAPEHAWLEEWIDVAPDVKGSAFGSVDVKIEQPIFGSINMTTSVVLKNGESLVIGGSPSEDGEGMHYMILSASLI